jgi:tetratricopeptide (TPR) repeat protein
MEQYLSKFKEDKIAREFLRILKRKMFYFSEPMEFEKILNGELKYPGYFVDMSFRVPLESKNIPRIVKLLEKSIKSDPKTLSSYEFLALEHLYSLRDYPAALIGATLLIQKAPASPMGYSIRACALWEMGMRQEALNSAHMALERNPYDLETLRFMVKKLQTSGDIENLLYYYYRLILASPFDPQLFLMRAKLYVEIGEIDGAINDMNKAERLAKGDIRMGRAIQQLKGIVAKMKKDGKTKSTSSE